MIKPPAHFGFLTARISRLIFNAVKQDIIGSGYNFAPSCLGILIELNQENDLSQQYLGGLIAKNKSSVNKMITALETNGLVVRDAHPHDSRSKLVHLTSNGKAFTQKIEKKIKHIHRTLHDQFSEEEVKKTIEVLQYLFSALSKEKKLLNHG